MTDDNAARRHLGAAQPVRDGSQTRSETPQRVLRASRIAILVVAVTVQCGLCLPRLLANRGSNGLWWTEAVAFAVLAVVAVVAAITTARGSASDSRGRMLAGICLSAGVLASTGVPGDLLLAPEDWSFGLVGWYGIVLLFDLPLRSTGAFLATHLVLTAAEVVVKGVPDSAVFASMAIAAVSVCGFQFAIALIAQLLRRTAVAAGEAAAREEQLRTREVIAESVHEDYQARYATLLDTTVPLLAGLADGSLEPSDADTRRRCAIEAARMRRLFAESDEVADRLVHELRAGIDIAERHGVSVQLAVRGPAREIPRPARRELVEAASVVLASAASTARATVVRTSNTVRVSVVADAPADAAQGLADVTHVGISTTTKDTKLWVEAVWPRTRSQ
ncbi:hypothetical protein ABZ863_28520 [Saccharomonospora sp. NPDC046836]|uniref:hypothetical protein n=1 Tax=Saccharomonospora sp. NPDC046836 TaxID=3156921 RepID=UPI0033D867B8